jgi:hypothetical protein
MLGDDVDKAGCTACGDADVMENSGKEPSTIHGLNHGRGYKGRDARGLCLNVPAIQRVGYGLLRFGESQPNFFILALGANDCE